MLSYLGRKPSIPVSPELETPAA